MGKYIGHLEEIINKVNGESVTPIDQPPDETPDELPEIVQYPSRLPDYVISALKSADSSIINKALNEALQAQLISPITKETIQMMRNIYQQTTSTPGSGPTKENFNNFIDIYIDPT